MYEILFTNEFKKNYKLCEKRKHKMYLLDNLLIDLAEKGTLPEINKPHVLSGKLAGIWEAHIKSDWLLVWIKDEKDKTITLLGTGTHSDLFK